VGTKKERIYGKGAPFKEAPQAFGGEVAPNCPPPWIHHWINLSKRNSEYINLTISPSKK